MQKPKKKNAQKFAVIDSETDPFEHGAKISPFVWGYYDGENYEEFDSTESMVEFIRAQDGIIYAHNGGKFDFHFLLPWIDEYTDLTIIEGRLSKIPFGNVELRDSWNIIPVPLGAYKKDDFDYDLMLPQNRIKPKNKAKISAYLRNDCVFLYELIARFYEENGSILTQAGAAMKHWRKMSIVEVPRSTAGFYDDFQKYYYGGRVQCFQTGIIETDFSVYDINSAYPFAMLAKHPYSTNYAIKKGYAPAHFYDVECESSGAFPYREKSGLAFPCDSTRRLYHVTSWEFEAAMETKTIRNVNVIRSFVFCGTTDFSEYVNKFFSLRLEAKAKNDDAGSLIFKLLMNSLYGKFASNPEKHRVYMNVPFEDVETCQENGWKFAGELGEWALVECGIPDYQKNYYNVATGASITGFVRAMLWRAICASGGMLYCDTDSIACEKAASTMTQSDALGAWKNEGQFKRAGIGGKKLYIFEGANGTKNKKASKGAKLTDSELWRVAAGETIQYAKPSPTYSAKKNPHYITRKIKKT